MAKMQSSPFKALLSPRQKFALWFSLISLSCTWAFYWAWWVLHVHGGFFTPTWTMADILLTVVYVLINYETMLVYGLLGRAKTIDANKPIPCFRVAMIVTRAPSEPFEVVQTTLKAMLNQNYPYSYDVWLADERPTEAIKAWCAENGIRVSCRFGIPEYHRATWPRRTKCKEGNLAYFYDHWGYAEYDVVAQFDCDHIPGPTYLSSCLPAFLDHSVGYVACPSVNTLGCSNSWAARGRLYYEAVFNGAGQAAWFPDFMPVCIGSHYVVRTAHLKAAGGIGPELDEDFSTSLLMTCHGFKGCFSIDTPAVGQGPPTLEDSMKQEYQWARSFVILTLVYIPMFWSKHLTRSERWKVYMCVWYYVWHAFHPFMVLGLVLMPSCGHPYGPVTWAQVLLHSSVPLAATLIHQAWLRKQGLLRPVQSPIFSWENGLHQFVKTYWILKGVVHALFGHFFGIQFAIKVTPKGDNDAHPLSQTTLWPFLFVAAFCTAMSWHGNDHIHLPFMFAMWNVVAVILIIVCHYHEQHKKKIPWLNLANLTWPILLVMGFQGVTLHHRGVRIWVLFKSSLGFIARANPAWDEYLYLKIAWLLVLVYGILQLGEVKLASGKVSQASKLLNRVMYKARKAHPDEFFVSFQSSMSIHRGPKPLPYGKGERMV